MECNRRDGGGHTKAGGGFVACLCHPCFYEMSSAPELATVSCCSRDPDVCDVQPLRTAPVGWRACTPLSIPPPPQLDSGLTVAVVGFRTAADEDSTTVKCPSYDVYVRGVSRHPAPAQFYEIAVSDSGMKWTTFRRFQEFYQLHETVRINSCLCFVKCLSRDPSARAAVSEY